MILIVKILKIDFNPQLSIKSEFSLALREVFE